MVEPELIGHTLEPVRKELQQLSDDHRILQESFQNLVKHASATEVLVKLTGSPKGISLSVTDNGRGFDVHDKSSHHMGLGLSSMRGGC